MHGHVEAVEGGVAAQGVEMTLVRHVIDARAGVRARDAQSDAVPIVAPPVWEAHDTREHRIGHFHGHRDGASLRCKLRHVSGHEVARCGVLRVYEERA